MSNDMACLKTSLERTMMFSVQFKRCGLCLTIALLYSACADTPRASQAILVGGSPNEDACGALGLVRDGLDQVSVRSGPFANAERLDRLSGGAIVWFCDEAPGWIGVVYGSEADADCGVATPAASRTAYAGPCKAGWVDSAHLTLVAG